MRDGQNDGGPAFPFVSWRSPDGMIATAFDPGMSLRDWFAGQALASIGATNPNLPGDPAGHHWPDADVLAERKAKWAYVQADAMLAARVPSITTAEKV